MKMKRKIAVSFIVMVLILLMKVPTFAADAKTKLVTMHDIGADSVDVIEDEITDSYGNNYKGNVLRFDALYDAYISYDLNGAYDSFDATIVCSTDTASSAEMDVGIYADGIKVYELKGYTRQKAAETVHLDMTGVGTLSIMTTSVDSYSYTYLYFVNSTFEKSETVTSYPNRTSLSDLVIIDSYVCETSDRLMKDSFGNIHRGWARLDAWYEPYILYNLDKKYVTLTGSIVTGTDTGSNASMNIKMYLDDEEVYSKSDISRNTAQIDFELDVTNASVLRVEASRNDGSYTYVFVTDSILKAHEHVPDDWTVQKEATCTEDGEKVQICRECGEVVATERIPATGHTPNGFWEYGDDGTCNKVQKCTVCGNVALRQTDEEAEHTLSGEWVVIRDAKCDAEGERGQYCTVCNKIALTETIPTTEHEYGKWSTVSGSIWNNPIIKERTCSICGNVEHVESNATSWLKPLVIAIIIIIFGGIVVIIVTLKMNGLTLEPASIKKLFSKDNLTDSDIDDILNKTDDESN